MADLDDIINTGIAEAYGEGPEGMRRVFETILNRSAIRGITPGEVVRQPNQYTGYFAPGPAAVAAQKDQLAREAAQAAWELARRPGDPTNGADHYHADYVSPYWAAEMPSTGSFGRHSFYASQPVPQEALARLLVPETRNVPLPRARPASPMDQIAAMFAGSFNGAGQRQDTAAGLDEYVQRTQSAPRSIASNDMVFGTGIVDSHRSAASAAPKGLADLLEAFVRPKPALTTGARQTYAAQDAAAPKPDLFSMNGDDRGEWVEGTIIPLRQPSSGVGQPPATRTVQSVPVPRQAAPQMTTAQIRADNGQTRPTASRPVANPNSRDSVALREAAARTAAMFGFGAPTLDVYGAPIPASGVPYAANSVNNDKDQSRLQPKAAVIDRNSNDLANALGVGPQKTAQTASGQVVPLPKPRPQTGGGRVAVTHQQVANPEYQRLLQQISRGEAQMLGISASGRPMSRDAYAATQASQASIEALRRALAATPKTVKKATAPAPLKITVTGGGGGQSSPTPTPSFAGTSSGKTYTPGQQYSMGGDTYTANANGSFTNDRTGRTQGTGTTYYDPDSNTFKTR
jgi:hypothetical protein